MARFTAFPSDSEDEGSSSGSTSRSPPRQPYSNVPKRHRPSFTARTPTPSASSESADDEEDEPEEIVDQEEEESDEYEGEVVDTRNRKEDELALASKPWAQQLDLEPGRVHVMQASLFRTADLSKAQPKDKFSFLKHRRTSDAEREPKKIPPRTSFAQPRSQPPPRKYIRVASSASIAAGHEGVYIDAGLSLGRSFRVGWGLNDKSTRVGEVKDASTPTANSSVVTIVSPTHSSKESVDLLQHLLTNTRIVLESDDEAPYAIPDKDITFSSFSSLFATQDKTHTACVFRLGHALFDPLELHLGADVPPSIRTRVQALRRADALSTWLAKAVSSSIDQDIKALSSNDPASVAFLLLTGHQVEKAVDVLVDGGDIRLASVISQVPGDVEFREDIQEQLQIWKEEKVDAHMSQSIRKLYALVAGEIEFLEGSSRKEDINVAKGLDWLRLFGLHLWYSSLLDTPLREIFEKFEQSYKESNDPGSYPRPWYSKSTSTPSEIKDGLFNLLKLALSPSMSLESALTPLSYSQNPCDYKLPWLLHVILSQCLRLRDFTDRQLYDAMDSDSGTPQELEGYSQVANGMTVNLASQLQQEGLIQEAVFVLLFLDDSEGRKRAIKELLARSAPFIDDWKEAGLLGSLKIPREWVDEAKASHAFYMGDVYLAYELFTRARVHQRAHDLAISYLAPEAILRDDLDLLSDLFSPLDKSSITDFGVGGQLFIDYAYIVGRIPELRGKLESEGGVPDAAEGSELELLNSKIPKLIGILPDVLHDKAASGDEGRAALSHMLSRLLSCADPDQPTKMDIQAGLVEEGARLKHIHSSAYASFMRTIGSIS